MRVFRSTVLVLLLVCCLGSVGGVALAHQTLVVTEVTTSFVPTDVPPAGPSVGDSFTFTADLLVGEEQVGASAGRSVTVGQESDGDLTGFIVERLDLGDGEILAFGRYNQSGLQRGEPATIRAIGIGGAYSGQTGTLTNQPIEQGLATLTIELR
jgi:hypothetical protein